MSAKSPYEADPSWRKDAACRDTDPNLFFPTGETGPALEQIAAAKAICHTCEVQAACLEYALATNQENGIWGGQDEAERRQLKKRRRRLHIA